MALVFEDDDLVIEERVTDQVEVGLWRLPFPTEYDSIAIRFTKFSMVKLTGHLFNIYARDYCAKIDARVLRDGNALNRWKWYGHCESQRSKLVYGYG